MRARRRLLLVLAVPVALVVLVVGGTFVYIHFIQGDPPPRLTLAPSASSTSSSTGGPGATAAPSSGGAGAGSVDGTWGVTGGSLVGYRVRETLFGQDAEAVGRTSAVTGAFTLAGSTVTDATFTVDMTKVSSDEDRRDAQFRGRIMAVSRFPTASFALTAPITLPSVPTDSSVVEVTATGDLTLHGTKRSVTFPLEAQRDGGSIKVNGTIPVTFADYGIDNPSGGPASVVDHGELEVLLVLAKQ